MHPRNNVTDCSSWPPPPDETRATDTEWRLTIVVSVAFRRWAMKLAGAVRWAAWRGRQ